MTQHGRKKASNCVFENEKEAVEGFVDAACTRTRLVWGTTSTNPKIRASFEALEGACSPHVVQLDQSHRKKCHSVQLIASHPHVLVDHLHCPRGLAVQQAGQPIETHQPIHVFFRTKGAIGGKVLHRDRPFLPYLHTVLILRHRERPTKCP